MSVIFSIGGETATITRNPSYQSRFWPVRYNHEKSETADGGNVTYDNGPTIIKGNIVIKNVSKAEADALKHFLTDHAIYTKNAMTITPPTNTDVGAGNGTALTSAYFDGENSLEGVIDGPNPPGIYDINFPYKKVVT
jgi:hypothetical protein